MAYGNIVRAERPRVESGVPVVESNVPLPDRKNQGSKWPINELNVNDSFKFPMSKRATVTTSARVVSKRTGKQFAIRMLDDQTCRLWRVA